MKGHKKPPQAYRNEAFLTSIEARPLRILAEYLEPRERFDHYDVEDTIVFYGSARIVAREEADAHLAKVELEGGDIARARAAVRMASYYEATRQLAFKLTAWSKGLTIELVRHRISHRIDEGRRCGQARVDAVVAPLAGLGRNDLGGARERVSDADGSPALGRAQSLDG